MPKVISEIRPPYRKDIQSLRALAVLLVVSFHADLPAPGGYVGVDVFFVISGFVVTGILARELSSTGGIRLGDFFIKRFLRLAPALSLMLIATAMAASLILFPLGEQQITALTAISAMLGLANFVIPYSSGDYFQPEADLNPLLHTWSLSLEAQLYIAIPVFLVIALRLSKGTDNPLKVARTVFLGVLIVSGSLAVAQTLYLIPLHSDIFVGYYSPFSRAWEFSVGALLALRPAKRDESSSSGYHLLVSFAGVLALVAAVFVDLPGPKPGVQIILAVLGAIALLSSGDRKEGLVARLSLRPLTLIGDWSYSIYLWHWPFIVFAKFLWPSSPMYWLMSALLAFVPAILSYYFVEQRVRKKTVRRKIEFARLGMQFVLPPIVASLLLGGTASLYWVPKFASGDIAERFSGELYEDYWAEVGGIETRGFKPCYVGGVYSEVLEEYSSIPCGQSEAGRPITVAIVGDSHAAHLFQGLASALGDENVAYFSVANTPPTLEDPVMASLIATVASDPDIHTVLIPARWTFYTDLSKADITAPLEFLSRGGKRVYLIEGVPTFSFGPWECKYGNQLLWRSRCGEMRDVDSPNFIETSDLLEAASSEVQGAEFIRTFFYLCDEAFCQMTRTGRLLYGDSDHLNAFGSDYFAEQLLKENPDIARVMRDT